MTSSRDIDVHYHMRLLVDKVPSMLAYWDTELHCRFANRAYEKWFGVDPDRLIGTSIRDLLGPELFALNQHHMRGALAGVHQVFERIVPGPNGVQRHALAEYIPDVDIDVVDGSVRGFLVQVTEVTQLRETQAALRREQELRQRVEEQAAALDALLQERTEMVDVLAHEVRQPLNNASAALQTAQATLDGVDDAFASFTLRRAQTVMAEVMSSIDNTLAVASLLARAEPIQRDDTDIDTLIAVAIADMSAGERDRVQVVRESSTRTALMDMSLIRLALRNLLANALKYSPAGTPVSVQVRDSDEPLALIIDVTDSGPGIPVELLPRLFSRGAKGRMRASGLGLGLYIARQVMMLHGGAVDLVNARAGATTLRLTINQMVSDD